MIPSSIGGAWLAASIVVTAMACSNVRAQQASAPSPERRESIPALDERDLSRPRRLAIFRAAGFPTVDAPPIDSSALDEALRGLPVETLSTPDAVRERLRVHDVDVLVLPYGSAFPLEAWDAFRAFVERGGGLVVLGGAPFHQPVRWQAAAGASPARWVLGPRQPTFAHAMLFGPAEACSSESADAPSAWSRTRVLVDAPGDFPMPKTVFELTVRLATTKEFPDEDGSAGPREGIVRPLVHMLDRDGIARACPLVEIDRLHGTNAGARWIFATSDAALSPAWIRAIVERALEGAAQLDARPNPACVDPGEIARLRLTQSRPFVRAGDRVPPSARVTVRDDSGREVFASTVDLAGPPEFRTGEIAIRPRSPLEPGLYHATVETPDASFHPRETTTGFWVRDEKLLASGPKLTVSRDWIRRDGKPMPIVGTTYMASDVHRKFLFEPNPHAWDRDFVEMARHGVNFVRTGLWTGWSRAMLDPGAVDEGVLRALDAFVLTAARRGIPVCFTFFAFLPPAFGGTNPYLDPRALAGQKAFIATIASRYRGIGWVHFDLINEPSYAPVEALWQNRPIGDEHERRAWIEWVRAKHGDDPLVLRDLWRDASADPLSLPATAELTHAMSRGDRRPRKARDFAEFSQDVVARWAATLRATIRASAGDATLVTLGQDEGGTSTRPAQQLHAGSVDYTAVHTWWLNDDLLFDGVVTKVAEKPNVIQETGLMRLEDVDGFAWRTPEDAARLLERKYALAFASRGAGAIQWAWNVNPFQPIDNEAVIGIHRVDGTAKLELRVIDEVAAFFREAAPHLDDFEPDPVVVVLPHSKLFAGRPRAMDGVRRVVRVLAERFGVVPTAISELRLDADRLRGVKLAIVPSPEMLEDAAARALVDASRSGTKVLVTGVLEGDPYGRTTESLATLGVVDRGRPVALREPLPSGSVATFDERAGEHLRRSEAPPLRELRGAVWHEPLPLDLAREEEPLRLLLEQALAAATVRAQPDAPGVSARVLLAPRAALVVCVNESPVDRTRRVDVDGKRLEVPVAAGRARLVCVERSTARVIASTPGAPVASVR